MKAKLLFCPLLLVTLPTIGADTGPAQTDQSTSKPFNLGPISLDGSTYASAQTITANALGSGVNGPITAQTGLTIFMNKKNWWTGGKVGEIDGLNVLVRQNGPGSDAGGILINVQNQGNGFLAATEFSSTIVDPVRNVLTHGIDVQEGVLNKKTGDFIGAVYTADYGALATGIQIQNSPGASWNDAIKYARDGVVKFSVDGSGSVVASGIRTNGSLQISLSTPSHSTSSCATGQITADGNFIYVCVSPNRWKRANLSAF